MDLGQSAGGLPPDEVVEDRDAILAASEAAISRFHDPSAGSMVRIALAPCSPFSVTPGLMSDAAELARRRGVRLHTHLAETLDEERFCQERFGVAPVDYLDDLGWLGDDVWLAHCVHLDDAEIARFGATGTGVAHCPNSNARLGAGIAPVARLVDAGAPVGLGVDGAASNEDGGLASELRAALQFARLAGGPQALTARQALAGPRIDGARCLGRDQDFGSLEVGKLADVALWRLDGLEGAGIEDPVAALVFGATQAVELLLVGGRPIVEGVGCAPPTRRRWRSRSRGQAGSCGPGGGSRMTDGAHRPDQRTHSRSGAAAGRLGETTVRAVIPKVKGELDFCATFGWTACCGRGLAQRAPRRGDTRLPGHLARAGHPGRARGAHPRGRPRYRKVYGIERADQPVLAWRTLSLPGRADRDRRRRGPRDAGARQARSRSTTTCSSR